jgi:hypothetical protein
MMFVKRKDAKEKLLGQIEPRTAPYRITWSEVEASADRLNSFLKKVNIKPERSYGYTELNVYDKITDNMIGTLIGGLTMREAKKFMDAMEKLLYYEEKF